MRHLALTVTLGVVALSATARAQETTTVIETQTTRTPITADAPTEQRSFLNRPLMITSGALLLATYVPSAVIGSESERSEDRFLFIPVAGPWVDLGNRDCDARPCINEDRNKALIIGSGILQGIGALGVVMSFIVPETKSTAEAKSKPTFAVTPAQITRTGYGLGAIGTF